MGLRRADFFSCPTGGSDAHTLRYACCALSVAAFPSPSIMPANAEECAVATPTLEAALSPDDAGQSLMDGNERFVGKRMRNCNLLAQVRATALGQAPIAAIWGRNASIPEYLRQLDLRPAHRRYLHGAHRREFHRAEHPWQPGVRDQAQALRCAKLVVVLGHSECGAIKGAIDNVQNGQPDKHARPHQTCGR